MHSMRRGSSDDGPKLREEKQFEDFYNDLAKDTLVPVLIPKDSDVATTNAIDFRDTHQFSNGNTCHDTACSTKIHIKQIIFNNTVTLEPISLHHNRRTFKKSNIPISQLNATKKTRASRGRSSKILKAATSSSELCEYNESYISKFSSLGQRSDEAIINTQLLSEVSKNLRNFRTEYDMDEQDDLYLHFLNSRYSDNRLTHETFELLMSVLEIEWNHLEKKIPPRKISANACLSDHHSQTGRQHYELYGSDDGTGQSSDQACAVCGGVDSDISNAIVFCDGCDVAVHQECYGIVFIPEGQWLCRRCLVSKNRRVNCLFCPSHTGALKQTDTGSWAHIVCGLWIPELYFANIHYMEPIEGVDNISRSRWKLICSICKQKQGACIQCAHKNCFTAFHVTCAKRAGLFLDYGGASITEMASNQVHPAHMPKTLCDKHAPLHWPKATEGILKTRRYFSEHKDSFTSTILNNKTADAHSIQRRNKWKTHRGTPIAPHLFAQILYRILVMLKIPNAQTLSYNICKYWSMKREMKRGAALVRKFDPSSYNILDEQRLQERLKVTDILLDDLSKLQTLTNLVRRRTVASNGIIVAENNIFSLSNFPNEHLIKNAVIEKFFSSEAFKLLESSITDEYSRNKLLKWKSIPFEGIPEFKEEIAQLLADLESSSTVGRAAVSTIRKSNMLLNQLFESIRDIDAKNLFQQDFTFHNDLPELRKWKGHYLKDKEGLSDVEDLTAQEERKLNNLLSKNGRKT